MRTPDGKTRPLDKGGVIVKAPSVPSALMRACSTMASFPPLESQPPRTQTYLPPTTAVAPKRGVMLGSRWPYSACS